MVNQLKMFELVERGTQAKSNLDLLNIILENMDDIIVSIERGKKKTSNGTSNTPSFHQNYKMASYSLPILSRLLYS